MRDTDSDLKRAAALLHVWTLETAAPEANRLDIVLDASALVTAVTALVEGGWGYLVSITGLDHGAEADALEILYHLAEGAAVLGLRVRVPRQRPVVPTLSHIIPAAGLFERELREMFGIEVQGLSGQAFLFLPDDRPPGVYPLRKDAALDEPQPTTRPEKAGM